MSKFEYCPACTEETENIDSVEFTYVGQGDWKCSKGHLLDPIDAFQDFRNEDGKIVGPFRLYLLDEPAAWMQGFVHAHDRNGVHITSCEMLDDGIRSWAFSVFVPWARIRYTRHLTEAEEKTYRTKLNGK